MTITYSKDNHISVVPIIINSKVVKQQMQSVKAAFFLFYYP